MKGVIPTPDTDQIFYLTLGTEGKIWSTQTLKILPDTRHSILKGQAKAGISKLIFKEFFFCHFAAYSRADHFFVILLCHDAGLSSIYSQIFTGRWYFTLGEENRLLW